MKSINPGVTDLNYMQDPVGRVRFYGIYSGRVVDVKDPLKKGRIRVQVPQVTGTQTSSWAPQMTGSIAQINYPYGTFVTLQDQAVGVNTATVVNGWVEKDANNVSLNGTRIYVKETGDYFFQFSAMFIKTNASAGTADMWIRKNGTDVPDSNTRITLQGSNAEITMTVGFIFDLNAGDYVQLVSSASASNTFISHSGAGTGPVVPGVVATIHLVGKFVPKVGSNVWVMFEGGDPEFPVWLGAKA